ncbi:MAG: ParB/RepB/Spo0J family partition protein [Desulfosarcina sp.]|nr:ParB/RepB/Spo0J family partition protein [Desulfobacterales bacterium]
MGKKMALGRGLDSLIPGFDHIENQAKEYITCAVDLVRPNRYQPRLDFSDEALEELSKSIKEQGIIQPLLVRKDDIGYELIAGERRLRAAKMAGFNQVPVIIKDISDTEMLEMSVVENIQREDLNPLEEAESYYRLINEFDMTQEQVAERVGKSRPAVANFLRIRQLPMQIKADLIKGTLSMGHARALLGVLNVARQIDVWRTVVEKQLSVRETEALIKRINQKEKVQVKEQQDKEQQDKEQQDKEQQDKEQQDSDSLYFKDIEDELARRFGTRVTIQRKDNKGKLFFEFYNDDDFDRLLGMLKK